MLNKIMKFIGIKSISTTTYYAARGCSDVWLMKSNPIKWDDINEYLISNKVLNIPALNDIKPGEVRKVTILVEVME